MNPVRHVLCLALSLCVSCAVDSQDRTPPDEISFELEQAGRVSLAVYTAADVMVRELLRAEPMEAGKHTVTWDGMNRHGQWASPGEYRWKLARSPGLTSEYLLSLGTSAGDQSWPGQHAGPKSLARDGRWIHMASGTTEGSPVAVRFALDGEVDYTLHTFEGWENVTDLAVADGRLYMMYANSARLYAVDAASGERTGLFGSDDVTPLDLKRLYQAINFVNERSPAESGESTLDMPLVAVGEDATFGWTNVQGLEAGQTRDGTEYHRLAGNAEDPGQMRQLRLRLPDGGYFVRVHWGDGEQSFERPAVWADGKWKATARTVGPEGATSEFRVPVADGQLELGFRNARGVPPGWAVNKLEVFIAPTLVTAVDETLYVGYTQNGEVLQLTGQDSEDRKLVGQFDRLRDLEVDAAGRLYVLTPNKLRQVTGPNRSRILVDGLRDASSFSPVGKSGQFLVFEAGDVQQVVRFSRSGEELARYGRRGGRLPGRYVASDFRDVADIIEDGNGGFVVAETATAPRRTSHFSEEGRLVREWYGGQQFYTAASPDPADPTRVLMDSQWGWLMDVQVDYEDSTWQPAATYHWYSAVNRTMQPRKKMARRMHLFRYDADKDGQSERYVWSDAHVGLILRIDEEEGRLVPFAMAGKVNVGSASHRATPVEELPEGYLEAIQRLGEDPDDWRVRRKYQYYTWADADGDGEMDGDEFRLSSPGRRTINLYLMGRRAEAMDEDLNLYLGRSYGQSDKPDAMMLPVLGYTAIGAPIWDWDRRDNELMDPTETHVVEDVLPGDDESIYVLGLGGGDNFVAKGVSALGGHGHGWPATLVDATSLRKFAADGGELWRVGPMAVTRPNPPGQLQSPVVIAGRAHNCVFVADKVFNPVQAWTRDGLYVGSMFDARADDGLRPAVYTWWRDDPDQSDHGDNQALLQYDMILGGKIATYGDDVLFFGSGWNNVPVYRIRGFNEIDKQSGTVTLASAGERPAAVSGTGEGLRGKFYRDGELVSETLGPVWFGAAPSHGLRPWPAETPDQFKGVWTGHLEPRFSEDYRLVLYAASGGRAETAPARVWLDGELIIDAQLDPAARWRIIHASEPVPLQAGQRVPIRVEYEGSRAGELHLVWESLSQPAEHVPADFLYADVAEK